MPVNKSKGNMYDKVDTWNPYRGCEYNCSYCYVKSIPNYDRTPQLVGERFSDNLGSWKTIFVSSTGDIGGPWVEDEWMERILAYCHRYPVNQYLFQSKNPISFKGWIDRLPPNTILGTTIETNRSMRHISDAPVPYIRAMGLLSLNWHQTMVSVEPIMDFDRDLIDMLLLLHPGYVSIGAVTKGHKLPEPSREKIVELIEALDEDTIEVRLKSNLERLLGWELMERYCIPDKQLSFDLA